MQDPPYRVSKLLPLVRDGSQCSLAAACTLELHRCFRKLLQVRSQI